MNWEQLQPKHGGRRFPWIRMYDEWLDDIRYRNLTKEQRADLVDLMLLANRCGNWIPEDSKRLGFTLRSESLPDIQALIAAGFVRRLFAGRNAANDRQPVGLEERTGEVVEKEKKEKATPAPILLPIKGGPPIPLDTYAMRYQEIFPRVQVTEELAAFARYVSEKPEERAPPLASADRSIRGWLERARPARVAGRGHPG